MQRPSEDSSYLKARLIARVLSSSWLRASPRWCRLARRLSEDPGVTNRLIDQAMRWFAFKRRGEGGLD